MVLDWKNEKAFALANGICEGQVNGEAHPHFDGAIALPDWDIAVSRDWNDLVFKYFPVLHVRFGEFFDCTFEDCQEIEFIGCGLRNCVARYIIEGVVLTAPSIIF